MTKVSATILNNVTFTPTPGAAALDLTHVVDASASRAINGPDAPRTLDVKVIFPRLKADDVFAAVSLDVVKKPKGRLTLETGDKVVLADFETSSQSSNWNVRYAWTGLCER